MIRLFKAEIFKLVRNRTFKVVCIIGILFSIMLAVVVSPLIKNINPTTYEITGGEEVVDSVSQDGEDSKTWNIGFQLVAKDIMNPTTLEVYHSAFGGGIIELLTGIFIAAFLAKEYSDGTIKNILAYGKKRRDFYMAKFGAVIIAVGSITLSLTLIPTVTSFIMNGWGEEFKLLSLLGMANTFIAVVIANSAIAAILMLIAIVTKNNGATIAATAGGVVLTPTIFIFLYGINSNFDRIYELTPFVNSNLASSINNTNGELLQVIFVASVTIIISLFLGIKTLEKQDIK